jgi:hypothetical protein
VYDLIHKYLVPPMYVHEFKIDGDYQKLLSKVQKPINSRYQDALPEAIVEHINLYGSLGNLQPRLRPII